MYVTLSEPDVVLQHRITRIPAGGCVCEFDPQRPSPNGAREVVLELNEWDEDILKRPVYWHLERLGSLKVMCCTFAVRPDELVPLACDESWVQQLIRTRSVLTVRIETCFGSGEDDRDCFVGGSVGAIAFRKIALQ